MTSDVRISVLVVDDQAIVREGIRALLAEVPDMIVVGEAADGAEAVRKARQLQPDVVLMDLAMPGTDGIEATRQIRAEADTPQRAGSPGPRVLVLTSFAGDDKVFPRAQGRRTWLPAQRFRLGGASSGAPASFPKRILAAPHDRPQGAARNAAAIRPPFDRGAADGPRARSPAPGCARP